MRSGRLVITLFFLALGTSVNAEPAPTEPAPTEPAPTEPAPTEPAPTEPAPTKSAPTESAPTESAPTVEPDIKIPRMRLVPTFALSGSTSGENTLSLGIDLLKPMIQDREMHIKFAFETASHDGVSTLLDSSMDRLLGEQSYGGMLSVKYVMLAADRKVFDYLSSEERRDLAILCMLDPSWNPQTSGGVQNGPVRTLVNEPAGIGVNNLDYGKFCSVAKNRMKSLEAERVLSLPAHQFLLALSLGVDELEQLSLAGSAAMFKATSRRRSKLGVVVGYGHYNQRRGRLVEAAASIKRLSEPSTQKAQWCTPVGTLVNDEGDMPALASCKELPLGDPTRMTNISAALRAGVVSHDRLWRASIGPTVKLGFGGDKTTYELGFDVPFYFVRSTVDFTGVVRVAPALIWTQDADGEKDTKVLMTISLLGSRTLLETAFQ